MLAVTAMTGMIADMTAKPQAMAAALTAGHPTATDLADFMVRELAMPFRDAHHASGSIVALADEKGCTLEELSFAEMAAVEPRLTPDVMSYLSVAGAAAARTSFGGTAPDEVLRQIATARKNYNL